MSDYPVEAYFLPAMSHRDAGETPSNNGSEGNSRKYTLLSASLAIHPCIFDNFPSSQHLPVVRSHNEAV